MTDQVQSKQLAAIHARVAARSQELEMSDVFPIEGIPGTFHDRTVAQMKFARRHDLEPLMAKTPQGRAIYKLGGMPHKIYMAERPDGFLRVMVSRDPNKPPHYWNQWRMSISHADADGKCFRMPTWDEAKRARYDLIPRGPDMAIILPDDREHYVDVMPFCLLMTEIRKGNAS